MNMKITIFFFLFLSFSQIALSKCKQITVLTHPNYPPFHSYNKKGELVGHTKSIIDEISKLLDIKFKVLEKRPWERVKLKAKEGKVDMIWGLKNSRDRREYLEFLTAPLFANPMSIFTLKKRKLQIETWLDLIKYKGGVSRGDNFGTDFDEFIQNFLSFSTYDGNNSLIKSLMSNRVDYIIIGEKTGTELLRKLGVIEQVSIQMRINSGLVYVGYSKKSKCLEEYKIINKYLLKRLRN